VASGSAAAIQEQASPAPQAGQGATLTEDYKIGARDLLEVRVFDLDQFNASVRVSEAGTISLPLIGEVTAGGLTRADLEAAIEQALTRYVNRPQVSVFIREYQSQRFSVIGAVRTPGTYDMVGRTTLLEAISMAGGINQVDAAGKITVLRAELTGAPLEIDLDALLNQGNLAFNIEVNRGDTINVVSKRSYFIYVYGQVRQPGSYELRDEVTLLQAISMGGGITDRAQKKKVRILRRQPDGTQELLEVNIEEIEDGEKPDVPVRPNDVIIVPATFF
jgi:polysaccharide export outer membrane protein